MSGRQKVRRGDVFLVDLEPVIGHEVGRIRPAVVVQNDIGNRLSPTLIVAAVTGYNKKKAGFPICVPVEPGEGGLKKRSIVNTSQIRTVDRRRIAGPRLGRLGSETLTRLDEALRVSLELP